MDNLASNHSTTVSFISIKIRSLEKTTDRKKKKERRKKKKK